MTTAAQWVDETLYHFGQMLGIPGLVMGERGVVQLELGAGGMLAIERGTGRSPELLVYLGRPLGFDGAATVRRSLTRAHFSAAHPLPVQVGVRGMGPDALLLTMVRIPEREFTVPMLAQVVEYLGRWSDGARNG